jgi:hypothetical protein
MTSKTDENQSHKAMAWIAPVVGAAIVFGLLTAIQAISFWGAMAAAFVIAIGGVILLRTL